MRKKRKLDINTRRANNVTKFYRAHFIPNKTNVKITDELLELMYPYIELKVPFGVTRNGP